MRLPDVCFTILSLVLLVILLLAVGCNQGQALTVPNHFQPVETSQLPYVDLSAPPPANAALLPPRPPIANTPAPPPPGANADHAWYAPGNRSWRYIVLHHSATSAGCAEQFDQAHRARGWDELGYHFVITNGHGGPDGAVQIGSRWWKQKWGAHTGNTPENEYNEYGIGICLVGNFMDHLPSDAQLDSTRRLVEYLMATYDIPPENVIAHKDAPNQSTECCGRRLHAHLHGAFKAQLTPQTASR